MLYEAPQASGYLSARERRLLWAITEAALPRGQRFHAADRAVAARAEAFLADAPTAFSTAYRGLLAAVDATAWLQRRRPFCSLSAEDRVAVLDSWRTADVARRISLRVLLTPLKIAHFDAAEFYASLGCVYKFTPPAGDERPRHVRERSHDAAELDEPELELECEVVVVGSGAGGAVVARELAEAGRAVVLLEEGHYFDRRDFTGRPFEMQRSMYRMSGFTGSVGNVNIPIPIGTTVGGTTTINSGTCYRVPGRVLAKWHEQFGLADISEEALAPHYEKVERVIGVQEGDARYLGGTARVIARGCERLGYAHGPLRRNAPECDGQGVCCWGCPTDAKKSTNVSYVPLALRAGAELFYGAHVDRILVEGGRAVGVSAHASNGRKLTVRAQAVVLACGALMTPVLLQGLGLCNSSGQLGRNLSIHPALLSFAQFDEEIAGYNAIPQGYSISQFHDEGLLYEGAATPLDVGAVSFPFLGPRLIELMESFDRIAMFGFMIEDTSRGRVRAVRGKPVITYRLNGRDVARLKRGMEILARVFFAGGARSVIPLIHGFDELRSEADLNRLRAAKLRARDFEPTAYHPLGTARMGKDPARSVVGPDHQAHDLPGLYITDGSAVPSSLAVNPQLTIMAMASRAAALIDQRL